jgi:tetratricopeptide (TPR) repeat protein
MSPRYLFGPVTPAVVQAKLEGLYRRGQCVPFDAQGQTALAIGSDDTWDSVLARLPADWRPDFVVVDLPYTTIPPCLWNAPVPLIGLAPDWNLLWHGYRRLLRHVDLVLTDTAGVERLAQEGILHARAANLFGLERGWGLSSVETSGGLPIRPATKPSTPASEDRDIDILFVGNLHPAVQGERLPWLARLAQLGTHRKVGIFQGVVDEAYRQLLRRARIVFNRSIRGECNLRTFEAAAAGALLFQEAGNLEVPAYFRDRQECVYYSDDNLEELRNYYLDHEEERRAIAEAAYQRVQQYTFEKLWDEHLRLIETEWPGIVSRAKARQGEEMGTGTVAALELSVPCEGLPESAELHLALGLAVAIRHPQDPAKALEHFHRTVQLEPAHLMARLNLAEALALTGQKEQAIEQARRAWHGLEERVSRRGAENTEEPVPILSDVPHFPPTYDFFRVAWEQAAWSHAGDPVGEGQAKAGLVRWRLHALLAELTGDLAHAYEAVLARPDLPECQATLGAALLRLGRPAEAASHFRQAVARNPFAPVLAQQYFESLGAAGDSAGQRRLAQDRKLLWQAAPRQVMPEAWFTNAPPARIRRQGARGRPPDRLLPLGASRSPGSNRRLR